MEEADTTAVLPLLLLWPALLFSLLSYGLFFESSSSKLPALAQANLRLASYWHDDPVTIVLEGSGGRRQANAFAKKSWWAAGYKHSCMCGGTASRSRRRGNCGEMYTGCLRSRHSSGTFRGQHLSTGECKLGLPRSAAKRLMLQP